MSDVGDGSQIRHIIIAIRYSLLIKDTQSWTIARKRDFNDYKAELFNESRMRVRQAVFDKITLPSLVNLNTKVPDGVRFKVYIITSDDLPAENKAYLEKVSKSHDFIKVSYHPEDQTQSETLRHHISDHFNNFGKNGDIYASVRLDDDDALSPFWLSGVLEHAHSGNAGSVLSLMKGISAVVDETGAIESLSKFNWPYGSAGLTYIDILGKKPYPHSILDCGNHTKVHETYPTILDDRPNAFIRSLNGFNDASPKRPSNIIDIDASKAILDDFGISF